MSLTAIVAILKINGTWRLRRIPSSQDALPFLVRIVRQVAHTPVHEFEIVLANGFEGRRKGFARLDGVSVGKVLHAGGIEIRKEIVKMKAGIVGMRRLISFGCGCHRVRLGSTEHAKIGRAPQGMSSFDFGKVVRTGAAVTVRPSGSIPKGQGMQRSIANHFDAMANH